MKGLNLLFVVIVTTLLVGIPLFSKEDTWKGPGIEGIAWRNGNVGIGVSKPGKNLHVGGSALIEHLTLGESLTRLYPIRLEVFGGINARGPVYASCGMLTCSDVRYKKDLKPIENALDRVIQLKGVSFSWKDESMGKGQQLGVIGQEVEKVFPEVVSTDSDGYKSVAYS